MALTLSEVMSAIYDCEENCSLGSDWDGGWHVTIGGSRNAFEAEAFVDSVHEAARWLHQKAVERYPTYAKRYGTRVIVGRPESSDTETPPE